MTRRALLSVWDKSGLVGFGTRLHTLGFELVASGGTAPSCAAPTCPSSTYRKSPAIPRSWVVA